MITGTLLLLVRAIVFLVHDDQPEVGKRCENRAARTDHHVDLAASDALPLIVAFAVGEAAVLDCHAGPERGAEDRGCRRRERNLGHHQQNAAPTRLHVSGEPQIDLGLSTAGHAVQQRRLETASRRQVAQPLERRLLFCRQVEDGRRRRWLVQVVVEGIAFDAAAFDRDEPESNESGD